MKKKLLLICLLTLSILSFSYAKNTTSDQEQLRLMYDSFIFSKDLENAYKVAKKALKTNPNSLYWNKKMGEIALWTGRNSESLKHLTFVYKDTDDQALGDTLAKRLYSTYQYEKALPFIEQKLQKDHSEQNIEMMYNIYEKVGRPEESIQMLKELYADNPSLQYLGDILSIYLKTGEIDKAKNIVKKLDRNPDKSVKIALALSRYYFIKKDLQKAFFVLEKVKEKAGVSDIKYFEQLSDLGWYLKKYNSSVYGSLKLYKNKTARLIDYQRIIEIYKNTNPLIIKDVSLDAAKRYGESKFFIEYAQNEVKKKRFKELNELIEKALLDKNSKNTLENDPRFWLVKASVDSHFKRTIKVKEDLKRAISLKSNSVEVTSQTLWQLIDLFEYDALAIEVQKVEENKNIDHSLWHPLAAASLALQRPDNAMIYLKKSLQDDPENLDLHFLHAWILSAQGKEKQRKKKLKNILDTLSKQSNKNQSLLKNKKFARQYLEASIEFYSPQKFQKSLNLLKNNLSKKDYQELQLLYTLKQNDYKKASFLLKNMPNSSPITAMEVAHLANDKKQESLLISRFPQAVPIQIKIENTQNTHNMSHATKLTKNALKYNKQNPYLIKNLKNLHKLYNNHFDIEVQFNKEGSLDINTIELKNFYYLYSGFGFITEIKNFQYKSDDFEKFSSFKSNDLSAHLGVRKHIVNGDIQAGITYRSAQEDDFGFLLKLNKTFAREFHLELKAQNSARTEDTGIYMLVGGKKDSASLQATYEINSNQNISLLGEYLSYLAADNTKIGKGVRGDLSWNYTFTHNPGTGMRLFYSKGQLDENSDKGSINTLLSPYDRNNKLLGSDYQNIGIGFNFNDSNSYDIGSSLHPYLDISALHSDIDNRIHADISAGFIGSASKKDMYKLGFKYQNRLSNIGQKNSGVNFSYSRLY